MAILTTDEIAQYRSAVSGNPAAMAAIVALEDCEGDLEDAALGLAIRSGLEPDQSTTNWLEGWAKNYRYVICQEDCLAALTTGNLLAAIRMLVERAGLNPSLATLVVLLVLKTGIEPFCHISAVEE